MVTIEMSIALLFDIYAHHRPNLHRLATAHKAADDTDGRQIELGIGWK